MSLRLLLLPALAGLVGAPSAQSCRTQSVGLFGRTAAAETAYVLWTAAETPHTWLLDRHGREVHRWTATGPVQAATLGDDGLLLRALRLPNAAFAAHPGASGRLELVDFDGRVVWWHELSTPTAVFHHDVVRLPGGDVLVTAWQKRDAAELLAAGRDPNLIPTAGYLLDERILRLTPDLAAGSNARIAWEWSAFDHLVQDRDPNAPTYGRIADHPDRIDLHYGRDPTAPDWLTVTGIDVDTTARELLLTSFGFDEVWVLDLATTTTQAAGPAGDLRYRWGNPEAYARGGIFQHLIDGALDAVWLDGTGGAAPRIALFSAGLGAGDSVLEVLTPPREASGGYSDPGTGPFGPPQPERRWMAAPGSGFFSATTGRIAEAPGGHLVAAAGGNGVLVEVATDGAEAWRYVSPWTAAGPLPQGAPIPGPIGARGNAVVDARWLAADHPGLVGRTLVPGDVLELGYGVEILTGTGSAAGGRVAHGLCVSFEDLLLPLRLDGVDPDTLGALFASLSPTTARIPPSMAELLVDDPWIVTTFRTDRDGSTLWPLFATFPGSADVWLQFGTFRDLGRGAITVAGSPLVRVWRR